MFRPQTGRVAGALAALLLLSLLTATSSFASTTDESREPPVYRPPVDAPVIDPFRVPPNPFAAGNRGVDYGTAPGDTVHASAPGVVTFAGPVAGALHVVILHSDGLRTSYSFLASIAVRRGQEVGQGAPVGAAGLTPLHFGARQGDEYVDPLGLLTITRGRAKVRLLPDDGKGLPPESEERSALARLFRIANRLAVPASAVAWAGGAALDITSDLLPDSLDQAAAALVELASSGDLLALVRELRRYLPDPSLAEIVAAMLRTMAAVETPLSVSLNFVAWQLTKGPCTPRSTPTPRREVGSRASDKRNGGSPGTGRRNGGSPAPGSGDGVPNPPAAAVDRLGPDTEGRARASNSPGNPHAPKPGISQATEVRPDGAASGSRAAHPGRPSVLSERRLAVLVGGLGSSSGHAAILDLDTEALGYRAEDTVQFSYRGETTDENTYSAADTQIPFAEAGRRLAALLDRMARENPGIPIDVFAHSQGGLVARSALANDAPPSVVNSVKHLVTFGTPHGGADLAALVDGAKAHPPGAVAAAIGSIAKPLGLDPSKDSLDALAPDSRELRALADAKMPPQIKVTSIAARSDVVVPAPRSWLPDATNVVVPGAGLNAHGTLPGSDDALREAALAVSDRPPTCESILDAALDTATLTAVYVLERSVANAARPQHMFDRTTAYR